MTKNMEKIRLLVAQMFCASGCSCCRDDAEWYRTSGELAKLLDVPAFDDGSGFDFYTIKREAKEKS